MSKHHMQGSAKLMDETIDRRRFIELSRKYAIVAPPAVSLLITSTDAKARCKRNERKGHGHRSPSCTTDKKDDD